MVQERHKPQEQEPAGRPVEKRDDEKAQRAIVTENANGVKI